MDLRLGPGIHLLAGANGAGKSTVMRLLAGVLQPDEGTVEVAGGDPRTTAVRRALSWLPTEHDLPGFLTPREVCEELVVLRRVEAGAAERVRAEDRLEALGVPRRRRLDQLSSGQRRKCALVAALVGDPPVLLLDEPFANLDAASIQIVAGWLQLRRGLSILTHHGVPPLSLDSRWELG